MAKWATMAKICAYCKYRRFTSYEEATEKGWSEFGLSFCDYYNRYFPNQQDGEPAGLRTCIHWEQRWKPEE